MSITLMSKVWTLDLGEAEIGRARQHVLMALADHANDEGYCYPSESYVAWKTGYSVQQVKRILQDLKGEDGKGIITVVQEWTPTTPRVYRLMLERAKCKPAYERRPSGRGTMYGTSRREEVSPEPTRDDMAASRDDMAQPRGIIAMVPKPSLEPSTEPSENQDAPETPEGEKETAFQFALEAMNVDGLDGDRKYAEALWVKVPRMDLWKRARDAVVDRRRSASARETFRNYQLLIERFAQRERLEASP